MNKNNNVCIVCDSGTDMVMADAEKFDVVLLPLNVRFNDEEFLDGVTISRDEFYNRMDVQHILPKTSLINEYRYQEVFEEAVNEGKDVICLTLSSKLSGCYQSALNAASEFDGKVKVIDTLTVCGSEYLLVQRAAILRDQGLSFEEIVDQIKKEVNEVKVVAIFDTLENLKLGGRISASAAFLGNMLSIKPILTTTNGEIEILSKAKGSKIGCKYIKKYVNELGGIDPNMPVLFCYSGIYTDNLEQFVKDTSELYSEIDVDNVPISRVGSTIGTYTGSGAAAVAFFPKKA